MWRGSLTVSIYGYITTAELEAYANTDYSAVDTSYADGVIEANISQAERYVNIYTHTSFSGTLPDAVIAVTLELAKRLMHNAMFNDGFLSSETGTNHQFYDVLIDENMEFLLSQYIVTDTEEGGIDIIPMVRNQWTGV